MIESSSTYTNTCTNLMIYLYLDSENAQFKLTLEPLDLSVFYMIHLVPMGWQHF